MESTVNEIENHLNSGGKLTTLDALNLFHTTELRHYIGTLRKKYGTKIVYKWIKTNSGKRIKVYWMAK